MQQLIIPFKFVLQMVELHNDGITYSDTGNNRTTDGNNLIINLQHDAPALFYQCTAHGSMVGNIYNVFSQVISGVVTATFVGNLTGNVRNCIC